MTDINPTPSWAAVRRLETNEFATGGANGNMNGQAKSLAGQNMYSRLYAGLPFDPVFTSQVGGFPVGGRAALENGYIVRSTVANNIADPNVDMTGWVKTNAASQIFYNNEKSLQQASDENSVRSIGYFGGDITGVNPSDDAIAAGLEWSSASGGVLVLNGKIRITKTVSQTLNSTVDCPGVVFCENALGLTDGWMWDVNHGGGVANTTEIRRLVLSASESASTQINRDMKGLRVRAPHVKVGDIYTYGCLDGGVEFGPTGYEIYADYVTCSIGAYKTNLDALGFKISTTDCAIQNLVTVGYPIGANLGSTNFADNIHVWGFPATTSPTEYLNRQMLTGVILGTSTRANYIYVDTPETELYDTLSTENKGVALVFGGFENSVGSLLLRIHPQSKANKIKLIKYQGFNNYINYMHPHSRFDTSNPIIYNSPDLRWRNGIGYSTVSTNITTSSFNVNSILPTGVTQAVGTMNIRKEGRLLSISFYYTIQAVNTGVAGDFKIPLPEGLSTQSSSSSVVSTRSCLSQHSSAIGGMDFATINGSSQVIVKQKNSDTGASFTAQNSQLRVGVLELEIKTIITN